MRRFTIYSFITALLTMPFALYATTPEVKQEGDVRYVSGGVGKAEREQLQQLADGFDIRAVFTEAQGKYTSYVDVTVTTPEGDPVLNTTTEGPVLLLELPEGSYVLKAEQDGQMQKTRVRSHAGKAVRTVHLNW